MPAIAGILENNRCELRCTGAHQRATADGISVVVLQHESPAISVAQILAAYRRGGAETLHASPHDCAVAVFDEPARQLVLHRDAIGMHPLYYRRTATRFVFASRIADVLREGGAAGLARHTLALQLVHGRAPAPGETFFDDIHSIPPGCTLMVREGQQRLLRGERAEHSTGNTTFAAAAERFAELFEHAVSCRLAADGQTAVSVSGGLDSAAIISCADPQRAFGITYGPADGSPADEQRYVGSLRGRGYRIHNVDFYPITDVASLERNVRACETPFADDVPATLERAANAVRQNGAQVLLLGTWGDQMLAPFPPPHTQRIAPWRMYSLLRQARAFQRSMSDVPTQEIVRSFLRSSLRARMPDEIRRIRGRHRRRNVFDLLAREVKALPSGRTPASFGEAVHAAVTDAEHVAALEATIKWGLAHQLEVRLPFLNLALVNWLWSLPDEIAYHSSELKPLLRVGLRDRLPAEIAERRDKGDYTQAITSGMLSGHDVLESLDGLRRLVDWGLMSSESARTTLANLSAPSNISTERHELASNLLAIDAWLREFFEAR